MKSMKMPPQETLDNPVAVPANKEEYPYGLRITLQKEQLAKLGMKEMPKVGDSFVADAKMVVKSVQVSDGGNGTYKSVDLQITHLGLEDDGEEKSQRTGKMMFDKMPPK